MNEIVSTQARGRLYEVFYHRRGWALPVLFLTMFLCAVSTQVLLDIYDLESYPGQREAESAGFVTYYAVQASERALEFLLLALLACASSTKNIFRIPLWYRQITDYFLVILFLSPLLLVLSIADIVVFSYLIEQLEVNNRMGIGVVLIAITLSYYASIYMAAFTLLNKQKTLMLFIVFMLSVAFSDFVLFGFVDKAIGIVD